MKRIILSLAMEIYYLLPNYPNYPKFFRYFEFYRQLINKKLFYRYGENTYLRNNVRFYGKISIGNNSIVGYNSVLNASKAEIVIGDYFLSGPELIIYTAEHGIKKEGLPFIKQNNTYSKVTIGNNVYIGARVIILKGTKIGNNVIIGAGSVVRGELESNSIYAGVPAKKIKSL